MMCLCVLAGAFCVCFLKVDVERDLPPRYEVKVMCRLSEMQVRGAL
jgi:hypothetical protein